MKPKAYIEQNHRKRRCNFARRWVRCCTFVLKALPFYPNIKF